MINMKALEDKRQQLLKKTSSTSLRRKFHYLMSCVPRLIGPDGLRVHRCCVVDQGTTVVARTLAKKLDRELLASHFAGFGKRDAGGFAEGGCSA